MVSKLELIQKQENLLSQETYNPVKQAKIYNYILDT